MTTTYPLGYDDSEGSRLSRQAEILHEGTARFLARHLAPGMRVLDCGCGLGHVAAIAAGIVGAGGAVVGVDRSDAGFATASRRVAEAGGARADFARTDLADAATMAGLGRFDAVVGRLVLMYPADKAPALDAALATLRPGGVFAFQEPMMGSISIVPHSPGIAAAMARMAALFRAGGADPEAAMSTCALLEARGLRPTIEADVKIDRSGRGPVLGWLCEILDSLEAIAAASTGSDPRRHDEALLRAEAERLATTLTGPVVAGVSCRTPA